MAQHLKVMAVLAITFKDLGLGPNTSIALEHP